MPELLQGDTHLTGRWRHRAFEGEIQPMHEHCISAILSGTGPVSTWDDDRERKTTIVPGHVTLLPQGFSGRWCLKTSLEVCNVYLGPRRLQECADSVFGGRTVHLDLQLLDFEAVQIARLVLSIEGDLSSFEEWYRSSPIREFDRLTAKQLVDRGDSRLVIDFLWSIRRGERG